MHFGQNGGKSKTEAMFFPASLKEDTSENNNAKIPLRNTDGGYITTTKSFQYLGSTIMPDLHEDIKICARINKGTAQVAMMIKLYRATKNISLKTKRKIFIATAINTVLWGCKSWTMSESNCRRLVKFNTNAFDAYSTSTCSKSNVTESKTRLSANNSTIFYTSWTCKLWIPQATTQEWTEQIAKWWTTVYPTTDLDLAANSDLASNPRPTGTRTGNSAVFKTAFKFQIFQHITQKPMHLSQNQPSNHSAHTNKTTNHKQQQ
jgi:hypothetical protein